MELAIARCDFSTKSFVAFIDFVRQRGMWSFKNMTSGKGASQKAKLDP